MITRCRVAGFTLLETLLVCFFASLMLVILASCMTKFSQARRRVVQADLQTQALQLLSTTLEVELEEASQVVRLSPDLLLKKPDPADHSWLPVTYPVPGPPLSPIWDPASHLMSVRYFLAQTQLCRETQAVDGTVNQTVLLEPVTQFGVTRPGGREFQISLQLEVGGVTRSLNLSVARPDP